MKRKLIGITCNYLDPLPSAFTAGIGAEEQAWQLLAQDYLNAIWNAGAVPILLPVDSDTARTKELLTLVDGLLLSGGNDVTPGCYGARYENCGILDPDRDTMELALLKEALEMDMPILGICRGIQLMNVGLGGTLCQDLVSGGFFRHSIFSNKRNVPTHKVFVEPGTLLSEITGPGELWVNSFHHQAVKELAPGLICMAKSEEGVVEAFSVPGKKFAMAVQWHPEMMYDTDAQQAIFRAFLAAC